MRRDFDVAGVRVHQYDPDGNPEAARKLVAGTVADSLRARQARIRTAVRVAAERLTQPALLLLLEAFQTERVQHPASSKVGEALSAIHRSEAISVLLQLGALRSILVRFSPDGIPSDEELAASLVDYSLSDFGAALIEYVMREMGVFDPAMEAAFKKLGLQLGSPSIPDMTATGGRE